MKTKRELANIPRRDHLVDVDRVALLPLALPLLLVAFRTSRLLSLTRLGSSFSRGLGRHRDGSRLGVLEYQEVSSKGLKTRITASVKNLQIENV